MIEINNGSVSLDIGTVLKLVAIAKEAKSVSESLHDRSFIVNFNRMAHALEELEK